ncbi:hypothetical protein B0H66DRAFT_219062 [Apodospora peruviana]|uniref:Zn(2)-C6 fungal-type domain-containing protein n=1 Tax=Apodospora peruviana TaxID=516989 RepID=A0AAE0IDH5_9PEZI|nr:hypothetical protein B0H66DRAFT_219062 [Apodospora peruviana]
MTAVFTDSSAHGGRPTPHINAIIMQPAAKSRASGRRQQQPRLYKSCNECRRRKQKCIFTTASSRCLNCAKRWPQVDCVFSGESSDTNSSSSSTMAGNIEVEVTSSRDFRDDPLSSSSARNRQHPTQWSVYLLPPPNKSDSNSSSEQSPEATTAEQHEESDDYDLPNSRSSLVICGRGFEGPEPCGSVGGVLDAVNNCLNGSVIENTARNTELFYFFLRFVAPNMVSIDGEHLPVMMRTVMMPWMLQSPIFPNIAILMASVVQVLEKGREAGSSSEPLEIKIKVLALMNRVLGGEYDLSDVLRCVINLVIIEWFWGADDSMWAHLRGLKELVNMRGGPAAIHDPLFATVLMLIDYAVACCFETDLCVQDGEAAKRSAPPYPPPPDESLVCPLGEFPKSFAALRDKFELDEKAARILDDVRFLTLSITSSSSSTGNDASTTLVSRSTAKFRSTASSLHERLEALGRNTTGKGGSEVVNEEATLVTETIRLAALIYSNAIMSLRPVSEIKDDCITETLCRNLRGVSPHRWKRIPGIYLWVLVIAAPHKAHNEGDGYVDIDKELRKRYFRRKMATAAQAIGQEEFFLAISYLRSFWLVQRWIVKEGGRHPAFPAWQGRSG